MELHAATGPPHSVDLTLTAQQPLVRDSLLGRDAQRGQVAVGQEVQSPSRPQQSCGLRQPPPWVAPRGSAVLAHDEVVPPAAQRKAFTVALEQEELWTDEGLHAARCQQ